MSHNNIDCQTIRTSVLGGELTSEECQVLATVMDSRQLEDGETLVTEGDENMALFLLVTGGLAVIKDVGDMKQTVVYTMRSGECAGTRAFVDRSPRQATLRAIGPTIIYTMLPDRFETLLEDHPRIVYKVMRALFRTTHANLYRMFHETEQLTNYITKTRGRY
jgi:CRP-like cAMP-binding protein